MRLQNQLGMSEEEWEQLFTVSARDKPYQGLRGRGAEEGAVAPSQGQI